MNVAWNGRVFQLAIIDDGIAVIHYRLHGRVNIFVAGDADFVTIDLNEAHRYIGILTIIHEVIHPLEGGSIVRRRIQTIRTAHNGVRRIHAIGGAATQYFRLCNSILGEAITVSFGANTLVKIGDVLRWISSQLELFNGVVAIRVYNVVPRMRGGAACHRQNV